MALPSVSRRLRHPFPFAILAIALSLSTGVASAKLRVVASTPDVADMARQIGGDRVSVVTIANPRQDPHKVPVRPSFATRLHRADALVVQGLGLEHAFIPALIEGARNGNILPGAPGYIDASLYVKPLQVPSSQNRSQGELHPLGNPHFNLDPVQGKRMARAIAEGLERVDPSGADDYREGLERFTTLLDEKIEEWARLAEPLRGVKVVSYHNDLIYLANRYGLLQVGTIEIKPGIQPTPGHLENLLRLMKRENVKIIIREISYDPGVARSLAERTGARVVPLAVMAGGLGPEGYVDSIQANLEALVGAVAESGSP